MSRKIIRTKQKSLDFSVETALLFPTIIKRWFQPFGLHTHCLTNRFVCNFLSSSAGFNLCSCFFPAHPCLPLSFPTSLGLPFHGLAPLPFRFLTPAVFAFFRPLPVCFRLLSLSVFLSFSSQFRLTAGFPGAQVPLSLSLFPRSSPPDLSCVLSRFSYSALLMVSFRPALLRSRSCSTGDPLSDRSSGAGA